MDAHWAQLTGAVDDVLQQGLASQRLQHLGQVALHALALPGGKDDDREGSEVGVGFGHGAALGRFDRLFSHACKGGNRLEQPGRREAGHKTNNRRGRRGTEAP